MFSWLIKHLGFTAAGFVAVLVVLTIAMFGLSMVSWLIDYHGWKYVLVAVCVAACVWGLNRLGKAVCHATHDLI